MNIVPPNKKNGSSSKYRPAPTRTDPRFANLLAISKAAIISLDSNKRITLFNPAAEAMFGYSEPDVAGEYIDQLVVPGDSSKLVTALKQAPLDGVTSQDIGRVTACRMDGSQFPADFSVSGFAADDTAGYNVIVRDVSEVASQENARIAAEAKLKAVIHNSGSYLVFKGLDGRIEAINEGYTTAYGMSEEDVLGKAPHEVWPQDLADEFRAQDKEIIATGRILQFEKELPVPGGTTRTFLVTKFPVRAPDDRTIGVGVISTDINELADVRMAAAERETLLRAIIDHSDSIVLLKDTEGRYRFVNRKFEESYGLAEVEAVGKTSAEVTGGEFEELVAASDKQVIENGEPVHMEITVPFVDGEKHRLFVTKFPVRNTEGEIIGVGGINTDITRQAETEKALAETEARLRAILKNARAAVVLKDMEGRFEYVGGRFEEWYGYSAEEVAGKTPFDIFEQEYAELWHQQDRQVVDAGTSTREEVTVRFADGKDHTIMVEKFLVRDIAGIPIGIGSIANDITELVAARRDARQAQQRFRNLIDNLPDAVTMKGPTGKFEIINRGFIERYGVEEDQLLGKTIDEGLPNWDWSVQMQMDEEVMAGDRDFFEAEWDAPGEDGAIHHVRVRKFPVVDPEGKRTGVGTVTTDITERKRAEEALRVSESRFRSLLDNLPNAISLTDRNERLVLINRAFTKLYAREPQEVIGKRAAEVFPAQPWSETEEANRQLFAGEIDLFEHELTLEVGGGKQRVFEMTKFPVPGPSGEVVSVGTISTDITERKYVERAMRESEEKFRAIFEKAATGIALLGPDKYLIDANAAYLDMFGYSHEEISQLTMDDVTSPDDRQRSEEAFRALVDQENTTVRLEKKYLRKDGTEFDAHMISSNVFDENGAFMFTVALVEDITERKKTEAALRENEQWFRGVIDNVPASVTLKDPEGRFLYVNRAFRDWYQIPLEVAVGKQEGDLFPPEISGAFLELERNVSEAGHALQNEMPARFADGSDHQLYGTKFLVKDDAGGEIGSGFVGFDITEYKHTEELLRQAQKMQVVGQLTGGVAHDFNNLLSVVIGNLELVQDDLAPDTPAHKRVSNAFGAAERGAMLTHQLLAFSRQQVLQPKHTNIASLIDEIDMLLDRTLGENVVVKTEVAGDLMPVNIDRGQFENAVLNLSINARDAMPGGGMLTISAENIHLGNAQAGAIECTPGDYVLVTVADTGEGIPADLMERVFEPFFTTKDVGQGSGLGLSMVYGFVRQSGGQIRIESTQGEGTSVRMYFPMAQGSAASERELIQSTAGFVARNNETVMLVEDEAAVLDVTRTVLESLGYKVLAFASPDLACQALEDGEHIDLLLSDIGLPGRLDGHGLAQFAAKVRPGLKIVLISGYTDKGPDIGREDSVVAAFIRKPCRKGPMAETLYRVLYGAEEPKKLLCADSRGPGS